jgi:hypothetical protein
MKELRKLKASEVSLVPQGANGKTFAVLKESPRASKPSPQATGMAAIMERVKKAVKSFGKKDDTRDAEEMIGDGLSREAQTALNATALILAPHKDEITDEHMDAIQAEVGIEGGGEDGNVKPEHMKEAKAVAEKAYEDHMKKMGYQQYPQGELTMKGKNSAPDMGGDDDDDDEEEDVGKEKVLKEDGSINLDAVPAEMRPFMEVVQKSMDISKAAILDANKRVEAAEAKSVVLEKALTDTKVANRKSEIATIAKEFVHLDKGLVQTSLELADGVSTAKFDEVLKSFKAQETIIKDSAFRTFGSDAPSVGGAAGSNDMMSKVEKAVEGIVIKSAEKGVTITKEQAMADFIISPAGKEMYSQEKAQRQNSRHDGA